MFQLTEQTTHFTVISEKFEKEVREKAELSAQLLELKGQLRGCDREVTIVSCYGRLCVCWRFALRQWGHFHDLII